MQATDGGLIFLAATTLSKSVRIALFSDIHGNSIALDAVLADIQASGGVDEYWILGDLCAIGHDPVGVLEQVARLPNARFVRGNTDRYTVTGALPNPTFAEVAKDTNLIPKFAEVAQSFAWTQGAVASAGWLPWLEGLPLEQRISLPDGTRILLVHASPGNDDDERIWPNRTDAELQSVLAQSEADVVCVGHTHWVMDRTVKDIRLINPGSISNPVSSDLRAKYALITADESGHDFVFRQVEYDRGAAIEAVKRSRHPAADYIIRFITGQVTPPWERTQTP